MSFDIALNRLDHDLTLYEVKPSDATGVSKWSIWPIEGADRVAQQIKINLLTLLGEWFLDETWGVPYLEEILIKNPRMSLVESIFRDHITNIPNVESVTSFNLDWDRTRRTLMVNFEADTLLGPIKQSVKLEVFRHV